MAEYSDYGYHSSDPGAPEYSKKLSAFLTAKIQGLKGVHDICDLGCGNGYLAGQIGKCGYNVLGIDASETGISIARDHYANDHVMFLRSGIDTHLIDKLGDRRFDLVISSNVIEHLYRPSDLIEAACSLLRPGGYLIIDTPYHGYIKNFMLSLFNRWDSHHGVNWVGGHIKFFSVKTLSELMSEYFEGITFDFFGRGLYLWKDMVCTGKKKG
jgi:2-polyprenyl-3-methyl-5-hydroxy-6-metoxy-1,4-benzoquinol methylase